MSEIRNKQPGIRFKGFSGEWEKSEFLKVFDCSVPNNTFSRADLNYEYGEVKNIHYGDVLIKLNEVTNIDKKQLPYINDTDTNKYKPYLLNDGDVVFADAAEDETVGKATEIAGVGNTKVVAGLHTIVCRPKQIKSIGYLGYYINSLAYRKQLLPLMQGIKVLSISKSSLAKTMIINPLCSEEQTKIGDFFQNLDQAISLNQSKYDKLLNIKKACLEKMFPKEGATTPEVRFKGFSEEWYSLKITELGWIFIGLVTTMTTNYCNEGTLLIRNSDIKNGYFQFSANPIYLEKQFAEANASRKLTIGDVITVHTGDVGSSAVITHKEENAIGFATINTRPNPKMLNSNYLSTFLNSDSHKRYAIKISTGDGRSNYNLKDFCELVLPMPKIEGEFHLREQTQIGNFFKHLDQLISLRKTQLDKLKNIKKACLDKMFV